MMIYIVIIIMARRERLVTTSGKIKLLMLFEGESNINYFGTSVCFDMCTLCSPAHIMPIVNFSQGALEDIRRDKRDSSSTSSY